MKHKIYAAIYLFIAILVCGLTAIQTNAAPGDLDMTFGNGGKVYICDAVPLPTRVRVQPDGKVVTVASSYLDGESYISRRNADGTGDSTFGNAPFGYVGLVYFNDYGGLRILVQDFVLLSDGKILAVGYWSPIPGKKHISLFRLNSNGTPDSSFGTNGRVSWTDESLVFGERIAVQSDGKIIAAGRISFADNNNELILLRFNPDGTLDTSFGTNGKIISNFGGNVRIIKETLIQSDGKIIVSGNPIPFQDGARAFIVRYNPNGTLDNSFGVSGVVNTGTPQTFYNGMALQPDGKIVFNSQDINSLSVIRRYNPNGTPDTSFGTNGTVNIAEPQIARSLAIQSNGKILTAGAKNGKFALSRYQSNGAIDTTFGINGVIITTFLPNAMYDSVFALTLQTDGKIIAVGAVQTQSYGSGMARYLSDPVKTNFDFDGDGRADISTFRPSDRTWYLNRSQAGFSATQFGLSTDKLTPADYDGDGKTDIAVYRAGIWYLQRSQLGFLGIALGAGEDIPQPADFDGDGKAEIAVWRPSNGMWSVYNLATGQATSFQLGTNTDKPIVGDYDGDGRADYAVWRPSNGNWIIRQSTAGLTQIQFGLSADKPVPADYDGDGKTDVAVFRPSEENWYTHRSLTNTVQVVNWGLATDALVPADYDGDGKVDVAVYRGGTWYIRQTTGAINYSYFGLGSDTPTQSAYLP